MLRAGQTVAGRYLLESEIGEGAMGAVFRAQDQTLKRQVAIKFLFVKGTRDPQAMVDQFLREARIAASVQHRNVIHTVDFGTVDEFQPFMVMELLHGESLADRMGREPGLSQDQLIHLISLTLRGLAAVHDAGIVHRDLKPQNVFLQRDADAVYPKILDFGISRSLEHAGERPSAIATQEGLIVGTPDYMSPEQARGEADIDKRSDIYSMGVILYEGLSGSLPFDAPTIGELIMAIMTQEPRPLRELAPSVPGPLAELVAQAMSKKRENRFTDARVLRRALLAAAERSLPQARRVAGSGPPPAQPQASLKPRAGAAPAPNATWGDFEGLNATHMLDRSRPPPGPAPQPELPQKQRLVAHVSGAPGPAHVDPAQPPPLDFDMAPAPAEARPRAKPRKAAPPPVAAEDAFDPLYAGADQAAPDIDYDRAQLSGPGPSRKAMVGMQERAPQRQRVPRQPRARYKARWGHWVLPLLALAMVAYLVSRPALHGKAPKPGALGGADVGPSTSALRSAVSQATSDSALGQLRMPTKGRRKSPGSEPPHMRDVVF